MSERYADWLQRGREHQWARRPVDAMLCFQRAASLAPDAVDPRYLLGEVQWELGAIPAAVTAWRDAARVSPGHLASQLALAESQLALADLEGAAEAAEAALAIAPGDPSARVLQAVTFLANGRGTEALEGLAPTLASDASRLASPVTGGTLARVLDEHVSSPGANAVLAAIVPNHGRVAFALVLPLVRAALRSDAPATLRGARDGLLRAALQRDVAESEVDVLRRLALAVHEGGDALRGRQLAERYAQACAAFAPSAAPLRWPLRTAGDALRVAVLLPGEADVARALDLLREVAEQDVVIEWMLLARADLRDLAAGAPVPNVVRMIDAEADATHAAAIARDDPDVLLDMAGLSSATGRLLALRPAAATIAVSDGDPHHAPPLIDDVVAANRDALATRLRGDHERARARRQSTLSAEVVASRFGAAVEAHRSGDTIAAQAAYDEVLAAQPDHSPTLHLLAALHRDEKRNEDASRLLARAIELAPGFADARIAAARIARDRGEVEAGLALIDAGLGEQPRNASLWRVRGELELARHDGVAAQAAFANALALAPADAEAHYNLGVALQKQHRAKDAARAYQRSLAFDPGFADAHFNLAVVFGESAHPAASISAYRAVLDRDPRRVDAYVNLGEALLGTGRIDEWLANFRRFETQCPDRLPLAVQALEACQYAADMPALERYLEGLRRERFSAGSAAELTDSLEQLLYLLLFFDV